MGVPGVPWHTQILADHLTLSQPGGKDYVHLNTTGTPGFSDLPTALCSIVCNQIQTLTGVSYCTFMFFRGGPNYKNGYWLEKKISLKFLKCDQLTKARESSNTFTEYAEKVHEKKISRLAKQVLWPQILCGWGRTAGHGPGLLAGRIF